MTINTAGTITLLGEGTPSLPAGTTTMQLVMLALGVLGLTVIMLSTRKKIRRSTSAPRHTAQSTRRKLEEEARTRRDLDQVMIELDQLSRQIHARIDTKFAKLEAVIRDADERIATLQRLEKRLAGVPDRRLDLTVDDDPIAAPASDPASTTDTGRTDAGRAGGRDRVYQLDDDGQSPTEIAARTNMPIGEVELILSLRRAGQSVGGGRNRA